MVYLSYNTVYDEYVYEYVCSAMRKKDEIVELCGLHYDKQLSRGYVAE